MLIGFDTETYLIQPGLAAPPVVCASFAWSAAEGDPFRNTGSVGILRTIGEYRALLVDAKAAGPLFEAFLRRGHTLVAHNLAFDLCVMQENAAAKPGTPWPDVWSEIRAGRLRCTQVRETLLAIAYGFFDFDFRTQTAKPGFSLAHCLKARFGEKMEKEDTYRLRYGELADVPLAEWPEAAVEYPLLDAIGTLRVFGDQAAPADLPQGPVVTDEGVVDEVPQTLSALALAQIGAYGVRTDPPAVDAFEAEHRVIYENGREAAAKAGYLKRKHVSRHRGEAKDAYAARLAITPPEFTKDLAKIRAEVERVFGGPALAQFDAQHPRPTAFASLETVKAWEKERAKTYFEAVPRSEGDQTQYGAEVLEKCGGALAEYAESLGSAKLIETYLPVLRRGTQYALTSSPHVLVKTGRTSWTKPNLQNPPRKGAFRACFVPRPGNVFASVDFGQIELCAIAQIEIWLFGRSAMADAINQGKDLHIHFAASVEGDTYERAMARYKAKDPVYYGPNGLRQLAKIANFGLGGGMGAATFVENCASYGVEITETRAKLLIALWKRTWPEKGAYFRYAGDLTEYGPATVRQFGSARLRGDCHFMRLCNTLFQGLAADGAKAGLVDFTEACDKGEPGFEGVFPWLFMHDEILAEGPAATAEKWAKTLAAIMRENMARYIPDVKITAEPALMTRWHKGAEPVFNQKGELIPWEPK